MKSNQFLVATFEANSPFPMELTIPTLKSAFKLKQQEYLSSECAEMPKLRTFMLFKDFQEPPAYITKPLTFHQRRMVAKTRLGCLLPPTQTWDRKVLHPETAWSGENLPSLQKPEPTSGDSTHQHQWPSRIRNPLFILLPNIHHWKGPLAQQNDIAN